MCVGVCTIRRPQMLEKCVRSLISQENVSNIDLHILVIDNDATPSSQQVVEAAGRSSPFPIHYHHEPRRGIPMARNRVLEEAIALGADWLAFIDDDQTAHPSWMEKALFVAQRDNADVVKSRTFFVLPEPLPFWSTHRNPDPAEIARAGEVADDGPIESRRRREVATNGVLLSARLIRADGMGLRFNERLALGGLEDGEFFTRASEMGAVIVRSAMPVVTEEGHPSRATYWRQMLRGLAQGGAMAARYKLTNPTWRMAFRYVAVSILRSLRGIGQLLISPFFAPFAMRRFKFTALEGGRNLFVAAGALGGLFSLQYGFYDRIDGY
ncbi:MAG: glycosyltransferase family 2 protein [Rhodomicrobium sp.]